MYRFTVLQFAPATRPRPVNFLEIRLSAGNLFLIFCSLLIILAGNFFQLAGTPPKQIFRTGFMSLSRWQVRWTCHYILRCRSKWDRIVYHVCGIDSHVCWTKLFSSFDIFVQNTEIGTYTSCYVYWFWLIYYFLFNYFSDAKDMMILGVLSTCMRKGPKTDYCKWKV